MVFKEENSIYNQIVASNTCFNPHTFRLKLLRAITILYLPFFIVKNNKFKDLILYASPNLRGNNTLLKSNNTIKVLLLQMFIAFRVILVALLLNSHTKVHISFNL